MSAIAMVAAALFSGVNLNGNIPYGAAVTWNPSDKGAGVALTNGNLTATCTAQAGPTNTAVRATAAAPAGTSVFEVTIGARTGTARTFAGILVVGATLTNFVGGQASIHTGCGYDQTTGNGYLDGSNTFGPFATLAQNDILGIKLTATTIKFYKNGSLLATVTHGLGATVYAAASCGGAGVGDSAADTVNFGASSFAYNYP